MKLIIPSVDDRRELDTLCNADIVQDLERKVAELYNVYPVSSYRAFEEFETDKGETQRLVHTVFGYRAPGRLSDIDTILNLCLVLWGDVRRAWEPGSLVMWRRRPQVEESNNNSEGERYVQITLRIGSFTKPNVAGISDTGIIPKVGE